MSFRVFVAQPVADVVALYGDLVDHRAWARRACEQIDVLAMRLLEGHGHRHPGAAVETYRQRVPLNAAVLASILLARGADPNAEADMYSGRRRTRDMLISSAHPRLAGVTDEILRVLDHPGPALT